MTVDVETREVAHVLDGATLVYTIPFRWLDDDWITATRKTGSAAAVTLTNGGDFTVSGTRETSGTLTLASAGTAGDVLTIMRDVPLLQLTRLNGGAFTLANIEDAIDTLTMIAHQYIGDVTTLFERSLRVPATDVGPLSELPVAAARAGKYAYFNAATGDIETVDVTASTTPLSTSIIKAFLHRLRLNLAVGDDTTNDTTAVANALSGLGPTSIMDLDEGRYATTAVDLSKGVQFTGAGFISQANVVKTPWGRRQPLSFGQELLHAVHSRVIAGTAWRATLTGDSTTLGTGTTTPYTPHELFLAGLQRRGGYKCTIINRGQAGETTATWIASFLAGDLTPQPHLLIVRWGLNDPYVGPLTVAQTIANLRTALATARAAYGVKDMAILVCTPNSASDSTFGRDERWAEQVIHGMRQAALDYQCAFMDIYSMFQDSRGGTYASGNSAAQNWMDDPYTSGRAIHPANHFNAQIWAAITEFVCRGLEVSGPAFVSDSGTYSGKVATDLPAAYPKGMSLYRGTTAFIRDGFVLTANHVDDGQMQWNWGFGTPFQRSVRTRFGRINVFDPWDGEFIAPTLLNSWVNFGGSGQVAGYTRDMYGRVSLRGKVKNGTATPGTVIFTLPVNYRPAFDTTFAAPSNAAYGEISIDNNGNVRIQAGVNTYIALDGMNFMADG